ncbi:hypothetical protein ACFL13_01925 [Patescibacteria group bacterium]
MQDKGYSTILLTTIVALFLLASGVYFLTKPKGSNSNDIIKPPQEIIEENVDSRKIDPDSARRVDLELIRGALEMYHAEWGEYPINLIGSLEPYLHSVPKDPITEKDYTYEKTGSSTFNLSTIMKDGSSYTVTETGLVQDAIQF